MLSATLRVAMCLVPCAGEGVPPLGRELPAHGRARSSGLSSSDTNQARPAGPLLEAAGGAGAGAPTAAQPTCGGGGAGLIQPRLTEDGLVCVDMGPPVLDPERVPSRPPPSLNHAQRQVLCMLVQHPLPITSLSVSAAHKRWAGGVVAAVGHLPETAAKVQ